MVKSRRKVLRILREVRPRPTSPLRQGGGGRRSQRGGPVRRLQLPGALWGGEAWTISHRTATAWSCSRWQWWTAVGLSRPESGALRVGATIAFGCSACRGEGTRGGAPTPTQTLPSARPPKRPPAPATHPTPRSSQPSSPPTIGRYSTPHPPCPPPGQPLVEHDYGPAGDACSLVLLAHLGSSGVAATALLDAGAGRRAGNACLPAGGPAAAPARQLGPGSGAGGRPDPRPDKLAAGLPDCLHYPRLQGSLMARSSRGGSCRQQHQQDGAAAAAATGRKGPKAQRPLAHRSPGAPAACSRPRPAGLGRR
jgi:hypothetical protein